MDTLKLLAHPVRVRILNVLRGDRVLTTAELVARLPDVSKATVYRHVDVLAEAGVLEVAEERRVRGAVERHYRLRQDRAAIDLEAVRKMTPEDHRRAFASAVAALVAEFDTYLGREVPDPVADLVGYQQHAVWLDPAELEAMIGELRAAIAPKLANESRPGRTRFLLSLILLPSAPSAGRPVSKSFRAS